MNKLIVPLSAAVTLVCASQWASNIWLSNNIHTQTQLLITKVTQEEGYASPSIDLSSQNSNKNNANRISKRLETAIQQQVAEALAIHSQKLLAAQITSNNKKQTTTVSNNKTIIAPHHKNDSEIADSQQAFWAAMDIVENATLNANWDESINARLYDYHDQLSDAQRNEIVSEYTRAFKEGFVNPGITPPF